MDLKKTLFLCIICSASTSVSAQQNRARAYFKACLYFKDQWSQFHEELAHLPSHPLNLNSALNKKVPKFQPCRYEKKKLVCVYLTNFSDCCCLKGMKILRFFTLFTEVLYAIAGYSIKKEFTISYNSLYFSKTSF